MHNLLRLILSDSLTSRRLADGSTFADACARLTEQHAGFHQRLLSYKDQWPLGWLDLELRLAEIPRIREVSERVKSEEYCDGLAVFGIGGSALGAQAIQKALDWNDQAGLRIYDNVDPSSADHWLRDYCWDTTFLNVISKSGTTLETMAWFLHALQEVSRFLGKPFEGQVIATTDIAHGILRRWADENGWPTLPVPEDIGGRFSVFAAVGLLPLATYGVDIDALLEGASTWQTSALNGDLANNEAWQIAALHYLLHTQGSANCAVHYIYGDPLLLLGDWFRQLWAESLAKKHKLDGTVGDGTCLTPIVARGTTDQHSQNQLYMEGPDDKVYGFITCEKWPEDPVVLSKESELQIPPELEYLRGRTFGELLEACRLGTRDALCELGRPVYEIILPELSERSIGAYMQMWMLATAYAGLLYNVNAFDQPGVERSKQLAMARLTGK